MLLSGIVAFVPSGVTFAAPAEPAARLLPELGKAVGVPLSVDSKLRREVLLVRVKGVPLDGLLKRIAQATGGEWEKADEGYRLTIGGGTVSKQRSAEAKARGEAWLAQLPARVVNGRGTTNPSPLFALLRDLDPATLGGLGYKERVVFSTEPTSMQRLLPASALQGIDLSKLASNGSVSYVNGVRITPTSGPATRAQLSIQTYGNDVNLACGLSTWDAQGRTVGSENTTVYRFESYRGKPGDPKPLHPEAALAPSSEDRDRAVAFTRLALTSETYYGGMAEDMEPTPMYSSIDLGMPPVVLTLPEILQPERVDPLALTAGPLLAALADEEGTNLVADIPDGAFLESARTLAKKGARASELFDYGAVRLGFVISPEPGWTVVAPREPAATRDRRLDRAALGTALRTLARDHTLSLDAQAAYAAAEPLVPSQATFEASLFGAVDVAFGKRIAHSCESGERQTLRLYAAVGGGKAARSFGSLPSAAQDALRDMAFNSVSGPRLSAPAGARANVAMGYGADWNSLAGERTVFWGRGIPSDAVLTVGESSEPSIFGLAPNGVKAEMSEHGSGYGIRTEGNTTVVSTSNPRLARYQRGSIRKLVFTLRGGSMQFSRTLRTESLDPSAPILSFMDLPESLRKGIEGSEEGVRRMIEQNGRQPTNVRP